MAATVTKTVHLITGLVIVVQFQISFMKLKSASVILKDLNTNTHIFQQDIDHAYYTSKIYSPGDAARKELWVNIDEMEEDDWKVRGFLSSTHRQAERVNLSFDFPFYGHILKEITVATGGFIYTGDIIHRMLTATQYIAPLMADFDPTLSKNSTVFYIDNGTALVVQWDQIHLQDVSLGTFTFQAVLHIVIKALHTLYTIIIFTSFLRCSSGFDRNRQDWVDLGCPEEVLTFAFATPESSTKIELQHISGFLHKRTLYCFSRDGIPDDTKISLHINEACKSFIRTGDGDDRLQIGLLAGIIMMMVVMAAAVLLSLYVYNHPTSSASLFFMERRPTHWPIMKFRRGSGRPSYAEVEAPGQDKDKQCKLQVLSSSCTLFVYSSVS
uniref:Plexin domain containing 2a n=1 Tax=Seriola lalandi dorsalis TaxID=1841481 RepID=A0A3B4X037_SERLL